MLFRSVESNSEHPIARAIVRGLRERGVEAASNVERFENSPGIGVSALVDGSTVAIGRAVGGDDSGATVVEARVGARVVARFHVSDEVKSDARVIVDRLRSLGTTPMIVSGDAEGAVRRVADVVGIDRTHSAVLPDDKLRIVHELQEIGRAHV